MRIVVNHLTRMRPGTICVAGIEPERGEHVRPVSLVGSLPFGLLARHGGPFDIGAEVDPGPTTPDPRHPETEDHIFTPARARRLGDVAPDAYWALVRGTARGDLREIFGPALRRHAAGYVVDLHRGNASLGCLLPRRLPRLYIDARGKVRLELTEDGVDARLPVTDLRLYEADFRTPRRETVRDVARRLRRGVGAVLGVGLTRPWRHPDDDAPHHWLQVNALHLEDDPLWTERGASSALSLPEDAIHSLDG